MAAAEVDLPASLCIIDNLLASTGSSTPEINGILVLEEIRQAGQDAVSAVRSSEFGLAIRLLQRLMDELCADDQSSKTLKIQSLDADYIAWYKKHIAKG